MDHTLTLVYDFTFVVHDRLDLFISRLKPAIYLSLFGRLNCVILPLLCNISLLIFLLYLGIQSLPNVLLVETSLQSLGLYFSLVPLPVFLTYICAIIDIV